MLKEKKAEGLLFITTAIWGSTFLIIKLLVSGEGTFTPFALLSERFLIASVFTLILFKPKFPPGKTEIKGGIIIGIAAFCGYMFQTMGLVHTTPSKSGFITSLFVILIPFVSLVWEKVRIPKAVFFSLPLAALGLWAISGSGTSISEINQGDKITLLSAVSYAFQVVGIQVYTQKGDWKWLTFFQFFFIFLGSSIGLFFEEANFPKTILPHLGIFYLGIVASVGALGVQMFAQRFTTSARASLIYISEPIFATLFAWLIMGQGLSLLEMSGGVLILASMIIGRSKN